MTIEKVIQGIENVGTSSEFIHSNNKNHLSSIENELEQDGIRREIFEIVRTLDSKLIEKYLTLPENSKLNLTEMKGLREDLFESERPLTGGQLKSLRKSFEDYEINFLKQIISYSKISDFIENEYLVDVSKLPNNTSPRQVKIGYTYLIGKRKDLYRRYDFQNMRVFEESRDDSNIVRSLSYGVNSSLRRDFLEQQILLPQRVDFLRNFIDDNQFKKGVYMSHDVLNKMGYRKWAEHDFIEDTCYQKSPNSKTTTNIIKSLTYDVPQDLKNDFFDLIEFNESDLFTPKKMYRGQITNNKNEK
jgi:hypothetical protein